MEKARYCPRCQRRYGRGIRFCPEDQQTLSLVDPYGLVGRLLAEKYALEALVGIGGMGAVYSAMHTGIDRRVAFKILQPNLALSNDRLAALFEREAKLAALLRHENIADVKDAGRTPEGHVYMVMEWLDGETLETELAASGVFSLERAANILRQIAAGLDASHALSIIHCDLKPANLMLLQDSDGRERVKVLDFGIAKVANATTGAPVSAVVGTPRYASPEQLRIGESVDPRSDIYSLGVILYQMLTGALPYDAPSMHELQQLQQTGVYSPLRSKRPDAPEEVERLLGHWLSFDPAHRPPKAGEAAERLASLLEESFQGLTVPRPSPITDPPVRPAPIVRRSVGREEELAHLQAGLDQAISGRGLLISLMGEPGIGKTTIVEEFIDQLGSGPERECLVGRGRCSERLDGAGAYLPFFEVLENLIRTEHGGFAARLMKQTAPTWYRQVAPLPTDSIPPLQEKAISPEQMMREIKTFFQEASRRRPLVLFFDDLHWADLSTIDLLSYLASGFDAVRLLILTTYRPTEMFLSNHPFLAVKQNLQARGQCRELTLRFLKAQEVQTYLKRQFPGDDLPLELSTFVHEKTEGNPLFMVDLLHYLRSRGVIAQDGQRWILTEAIGEIGRELPQSIEGMIQRKTNQLGEKDRRLLTAASVQGKEFDSAVIAKALGISAADVEDQLETLEQTHSFIRMIGEQEFPNATMTTRYKFVHGLYQNALYESIRSARRAVLSAAIAEALLEFFAEKQSTVAAKLAILFEAARDFTRAEHFFLQAARNASQIFAYQEAIALSRRGLELTERIAGENKSAAVEIGLRSTLGMSLIAIKGLAAPEVEQSFARAYELCRQNEGAPEIFTTLRGLSLFYINRPRLDSALDLGEQLLKLAENRPNPTFAHEALFVLGTAHYFKGDLNTALIYLNRAIVSAENAGPRANSTLYEQNALVGCLAIAGPVLWALGFPDQALKRSRQSIELAEQLGEPYSLSRALSWSATLHLVQRDHDRCLELSERSIKLAEASQFSHWSAFGSLHLGYALFQKGERRVGIETMRKGFAATAAMGCDLGRHYFLMLLAEALGLEGQVDAGFRVLDEAMGIVERDGQRTGLAEIYRIRGMLCLLETAAQTISLHDETDAYAMRPVVSGSSERAAACYRQAIEIARAQDAKSLALRAALDLADLPLADEEREEARRVVTELYSQFHEGFSTPDLQRAAAFLRRSSSTDEHR